MATILEKGELNITSKDVLRYNTDCDSLMKDIGDVITKDIAIPSDKGYFLVFFPLGKEKLTDSFFTIHYDKDLNFESYKKRESNISANMKYIVLPML